MVRLYFQNSQKILILLIVVTLCSCSVQRSGSILQSYADLLSGRPLLHECYEFDYEFLEDSIQKDDSLRLRVWWTNKTDSSMILYPAGSFELTSIDINNDNNLIKANKIYSGRLQYDFSKIDPVYIAPSETYEFTFSVSNLNEGKYSISPKGNNEYYLIYGVRLNYRDMINDRRSPMLEILISNSKREITICE